MELKSNITTKKNHLCDNCVHNLNCALQSNLVLECEEHFVSPEKLNLNYALQTGMSASNNVPSHLGICSTCSLAANCVWRQEGTIRFQCEHYQ